MANPATQRTILRWLHLLLAFPVVGYVYTPFEELHGFAWIVRFIAMPLLILSGLWMWKGHVVTRLLTRA